MRQAKKYILANTLLAFIILLTYSIVAVARFQKEQQKETRENLERSLATMKELLAAKGELRRVNGTLKAGEYVINGNFEIPDKIGEIFGGAATIFLEDLRISTNIRTSDGKRAAGTRLVGPPYQAVIVEGRPFRGEAMILGVPYLTAYDPVMDRDGNKIGILFTGVKKSVLIAALNSLKVQLSLLLLALAVAMAIPALFMFRLTSKEEEARQAHVDFLRSLMDTIPNPVFYKDVQGRYLGCNNAFENIFGVTRDLIIGKTVIDLLGPEAGGLHRRMEGEVLLRNEVQMYEAQLTLPNGQLHDFIFYSAAFPGPAGTGGIIGTSVDLTGVRSAEKALREETEARKHDAAALAEKDKVMMLQNRQTAMGEMIGTIAHQWRQPLNTLGLISQEMLITFEGGGLTREYLEAGTAKIHDLIHHMSETINTFTNFFRPEKEIMPFMPGEVISTTLELIIASMKSMQIEIRMDVIADGVVFGYPNEYSQVLLNLSMNARDAFSERNIPAPRIIDIRVATSAENSIVTVTDNAGGVSEDILSCMFDLYFTTKQCTGTGIGLYLSKTIIEKNMHGHLSAQNWGSGARFTLEVPMKQGLRQAAENPLE